MCRSLNGHSVPMMGGGTRNDDAEWGDWSNTCELGQAVNAMRVNQNQMGFIGERFMSFVQRFDLWKYLNS